MKLDLICNKLEVLSLINPNDEYYTPEYAVTPLLKYVSKFKNIWCPFDLDHSGFVQVFKSNGYNVFNSHIANNQDFLKMNTPKDIDCIISNPPYSLKNEILQKLFTLKKPFAMLMGVVGIFESKKRFDLFKSNKFEIMYFNKRVSYYQNNELGKRLNPPFSSVYICSQLLLSQIIFEQITK